MSHPTYSELLRHPEWQKKRLRVMDRAGFRCEACRDSETTLNVHHSYYTKGAKPWEYPDESLKCLCENCHAKVHGQMADLDEEAFEQDLHELLPACLTREERNDLFCRLVRKHTQTNTVSEAA